MPPGLLDYLATYTQREWFVLALVMGPAIFLAMIDYRK